MYGETEVGVGVCSGPGGWSLVDKGTVVGSGGQRAKGHVIREYMD